MIIQTVSRAILDRIKADTGTGGLYVSSAWNSTLLPGGAWALSARPNVANTSLYPYLVYRLSATEQHTFPADDFAVTVTFTVYDAASNGEDRISSVIDRLMGDSMLQNGRTPSYGFNRHLLVLATNSYSATGGECTVKSWDIDAENEHMNRGTMVMDTYYSALAANP